MICEKEQYESHDDAINAMYAIIKRDKQSMRTYKCSDCGYFHLATVGKGSPNTNKTKGKLIKNKEYLGVPSLDKQINDLSKKIPPIPKIIKKEAIKNSTFKIKDILNNK